MRSVERIRHQCQCWFWAIQQQLASYHVYYNFCLPHVSLRQALPYPEQTKGGGSAKQWRPWTPAMAAGLTDRVWSLREVLLYPPFRTESLIWMHF